MLCRKEVQNERTCFLTCAALIHVMKLQTSLFYVIQCRSVAVFSVSVSIITCYSFLSSFLDPEEGFLAFRVGFLRG